MSAILIPAWLTLLAPRRFQTECTERAAEHDQRRTLRRLDALHSAEDHDMIADGRVARNAAHELAHGGIDERQAVIGTGDRDPVEAVGSRRGKAARKLHLIRAQQGDGEAAAIENRARRRAFALKAAQHERRRERDGAERAYRRAVVD